MTSSHIFYIPLILLVGFILGLVVGRRSAELAREEEARKQRLQERRQKAAQAPAASTGKEPPAS